MSDQPAAPPGVFAPSTGALREQRRRRRHSHLGVCSCAAARADRARVQHLRSRVHRERRRAGRQSHREVRRATLGRVARGRRCVHRSERNFFQRQVPSEQAASGSRCCRRGSIAGASVGAGAVVLPGLRVGARAMIGAGSVVTHDVPPKAIVVGNPAQIVGYVDADSRPGAPLPDSRQTRRRGRHRQRQSRA